MQRGSARHGNGISYTNKEWNAQSVQCLNMHIRCYIEEVPCPSLFSSLHSRPISSKSHKRKQKWQPSENETLTGTSTTHVSPEAPFWRLGRPWLPDPPRTTRGRPLSSLAPLLARSTTQPPSPPLPPEGTSRLPVRRWKQEHESHQKACMRMQLKAFLAADGPKTCIMLCLP